MSFYKKVTRGLATPLQGSINLFSGSPNVSGDEGTDADNENPEHRTTYHSLSGRVNHDDDDEDVAKLEDIVSESSSLSEDAIPPLNIQRERMPSIDTLPTPSPPLCFASEDF